MITTTAATPARNMVLGQLMTNDILDPQILNAMAETSRETFVPEKLRGAAYVDEDLEIAPGRFLMAPLTFAMLLDLAQIKDSSRVLAIGCLTGYAAAVIARLAKRVVATDIDAEMLARADDHMKRMDLTNVHLHKVGSLAEGYGLAAPYDAIVICGAVEFIPDALGSQLAEGGRLVTVRNVATRPDSKTGLGKGLMVEKIGGQLQYREYFDTASVLLPGFERETAFIF